MAKQGKTLVFGASPQFKLLAGSYIALFIYALAHSKHVPAAYAVTAAFIVLPVFAWPAVLSVSDAGVGSRSVWGRRRLIRWTELRSVIVTPRGIEVVADNGQIIRHSLLHARRGVFLSELVERAREKVRYRM